MLLAAAAGAAEISLDIAAPSRRARLLPYRAAWAESVSTDGQKAGETIAGALGRAAGADLQGRGSAGAQGDLSIRGSSFQQALVLIDGMRMNDPQTAHHNLDLPLTADDVERADVLRGAYSSVYGPDAYAGAVNIITRRPDRDRLSARLTLGDFSTRAALASCDKKWKGFGQRLTLEKTSSSGYREGTGHRSENLFSRSSLDLPGGELDISLGYLDKDFGASRFYSTVLSGERERTRTRFAAVSHKTSVGALALEPKAYYRRHDDRFSYTYNSAAYANSHATYISGAELRAKKDLRGGGALAAGGEYSAERIESGNIGRHSAHRAALFAQYSVSPAPGAEADASLRGDRHSSWGWQVSPGLRLAFSSAPGTKLWAAAGTSFRAPSFTELYYSDPGNAGNAGLKPERSVSCETGLDWSGEYFALRAALFRRYERDILDRTRTGNSGRWTANNTGRARVWGFEESLEVAIGALRGALKYAYVYKDTPARDYASKYALRYARHKAGLSLGWAGLRLDLSAVRRVNEKGYVLADAEYRKEYGALEAAVGVTNILDADYEEIPGAGAPGRWLRLSAGYRFI
ncbi:MAG: hypothetical protein A2X32_09370 [Elusimicrobia bacterium GWC2_64_44]|nr:MAG: hypothetical protein A2X32_09370 [Elusimicrobia bacterium GWC2_64_44]